MQRAAIGHLRQQGRRLIQNAWSGHGATAARSTTRFALFHPRSRYSITSLRTSALIAFPEVPRDLAGGSLTVAQLQDGLSGVVDEHRPFRVQQDRPPAHPVEVDPGESPELGAGVGSHGTLTIFAICVVDRVDHRPEHFQLEGQRLERLTLGLHGRAMPLHDREAMLHVARRLHQPALEIVECFRRNPGIVPGEGLDALIVNLGARTARSATTQPPVPTASTCRTST